MKISNGITIEDFQNGIEKEDICGIPALLRRISLKSIWTISGYSTEIKIMEEIMDRERMMKNVAEIFSRGAVAVLTAIDMVRYHFVYTDSVAGINWVGVLSIHLLLIVLLCVMVVIVNTHTKALMSSIMGSYNRQVTLMSELMIDPMTGLYNRRSFEDSLEKEIESAEQTGAKSYVTIFDIDHFKEVNDTYGHSNGDIVIKALCKMMKEKSKDMGLAFRYGGEEFVILFHDVELSKVMNVVEDIRTEFRCYYFNFMNKDGITCSCGVAEYIKGESSKAWFNRADSALYKAKESGRNRTVISE